MNFAVIGYGNLGKAVASALICSGDTEASQISVCDSSAQALSLAEKEHYHAYSPADINTCIAGADVICLVVKKYVFDELIKTIDKQALGSKYIISFMAEGSVSELQAALSTQNVSRAMPSLAIAGCDGVIAYTKLPQQIECIIKKFGYAFETDESNLPEVTVFASSGLGFASHILSAYAKAGQALGLAPGTAAHIAALTFKNACDIGNFEQTAKAVATPGGITEQGINHMKNSGIDDIITGAMKKALSHLSL